LTGDEIPVGNNWKPGMWVNCGLVMRLVSWGMWRGGNCPFEWYIVMPPIGFTLLRWVTNHDREREDVG
jgi:hypothetical protein